MDQETVQSEIIKIGAETDPCMRTFLLGELFAERGFRIIVTGDSAIELLTDGRYTSGDLDICFDSNRPPLRVIAEVMDLLGATGGTRSFRRGSLFIDILGPIETLANTPFREIDGVLTAKPEDLIPERVLMSIYTRPDNSCRICAEKIISAGLSGELPVDWKETERVASLPEYAVVDELNAIKSQLIGKEGKP